MTSLESRSVPCAILTKVPLRQPLLLASLVLAQTRPARAQQPEPSRSMSFPDRAVALRPTGMTWVRGSWVRRFAPDGFGWDDDEFIHADFTMQEVEARVPIGGLLLEAAMGTNQTIHSRHVDLDRGVYVYPNGPTVGAYFIDTPEVGWRYELGGAVAVGIDESVTADDACLYPGGPSRGCFGPGAFDQTGNETLGWNAYRRTRYAVVGVPRARVEWDPVSRLVLGAELEMPIYAWYDGRGADLFPQGSIEVAYRDLGASLVGIRTKLTSHAPRYSPLDTGHPTLGLNVTFEPFVRMAFLERDFGGYVRACALLTVGPAYTAFGNALNTAASSFDGGGYLGAQLDLGVLY